MSNVATLEDNPHLTSLASILEHVKSPGMLPDDVLSSTVEVAKHGLTDASSSRFLKEVYSPNPAIFNPHIVKQSGHVKNQYKSPILQVPRYYLEPSKSMTAEALPLIVAMFSHIWNSINSYYSSEDKSNNRSTVSIDTYEDAQNFKDNPIVFNWYFMPYNVVLKLMGLDALDFGKYAKSAKHHNILDTIRAYEFKSFTSEQNNQYGLPIPAFSNVFYWNPDNTAYDENNDGVLIFRLTEQLQQILWCQMQDRMKEGVYSVLPYDKVDWNFLRTLPEAGFVRELYLFLCKTESSFNLVQNKSKTAVEKNRISMTILEWREQVFTSSLESKFKALEDNPATYFFSRVLNNAVKELNEAPGSDYQIIAKNTRVGKDFNRILTIQVNYKPEFINEINKVKRHLSQHIEVNQYKLWMIKCLLRFCTADVLCEHIDGFINKYEGLKKKQAFEKDNTYDGKSKEEQLSKFLFTQMQNCWQSYEDKTVILNSKSAASRKYKQKLTASNKIHVEGGNGQPKKRGRLPKSTEVKAPESPKIVEGSSSGIPQNNVEEVIAFSVTANTVICFLVDSTPELESWLKDYLANSEDDLYDWLELTLISNTIEFIYPELKSRHPKVLSVYQERFTQMCKALMTLFGTTEERKKNISFYNYMKDAYLDAVYSTPIDEKVLLTNTFLRTVVAKADQNMRQIQTENGNELVKSFSSRVRKVLISYPF